MSKQVAGCGLESELYALWEERAVTGARMRTVDGRSVVVLSRGERNDAAGPDFRDAVLLIDGRLATGAVEMHRLERDWFAHGHESDPAYGAVVLHVVAVRPERQLLALPTVCASDIAKRAAEADAVVTGTEGSLSRELLLECAWSRLLRRTVGVLRDDVDLPVAERLRRAFLYRYFDALGYAANRHPMRALADRLLEPRDAHRATTFDGAAALLFGLGTCDPRIVRELGAGFMSDARLERIVAAMAGPIDRIRWHRATRPSNVPERRLWAAARLLVEIDADGKLERLLERTAGGASWPVLENQFVVRFGAAAYIGRERARAIVLDVLLPVALAAGAMSSSARLIESACRLYRGAPSLESNRTLRTVESRYLGGRTLVGGFWQQGAMDFHQRYLSADRSALTFVSEPYP